MNNAPILVFDSGVGGLPYLASLKKLLPGERFEYLADAAHFPYGRRTREDLERVVLSVLGEAIRALEPKLVVIACNTASQAALAAVRARHPGLPVVGTVPAVKPAADSSRKRVIGVLATAAAVEDPYLDELVARHAQGVSVVRRGAQDLVEFVEHRLLDAGPEERRAACAAAIAPLVEAGVDRIVLACTHFLHVAEDLAAVAGEGVETVDSRAGVARRVADIISERGLRSGQALATGGSLHATGYGELDATLCRFAERFGLSRGRPFGTLP